MSAEDACMSIIHHATSKIKTIDDLAQCSTFGFRGEALSSIASVSNVTLVTKEAGGANGSKACYRSRQDRKPGAMLCNNGH